MKRLVILLAFLLTSEAIEAKAELQGDVGYWSALRFKTDWRGGWESGFNAELRLKNYASALSQILLEPSLNYAVSGPVQIGVGYGWTPSYRPFQHESRLWQELEWHGEPARIPLAVRAQVEERVFDGNDTSYRLRGRVQAGFPLLFSSSVSFLVSEEAFFNLNSVSGLPAGFNQNRLFIGPIIRITPDVQGEIGVLSQYAIRPADDQVSHILRTGILVQF